jgi:bacillithiol biosynthesis deacetylase BshB1
MSHEPHDTIDVIAFGAHPDDVELTCSGTLMKLKDLGYTTGHITLTRGEMGTRGSPELRKQEFERAAAILKVDVAERLDLPDSQLSMAWEYKLRLIETIRKYRPRVVFTPYWESRHPDHLYTSQLVREASFLAGLKNLDTGQPHHRPLRVIYYPERYDFRPSFIVDVTPYFERKLEAIQAYGSQFYNPELDATGAEPTAISQPEFLDLIVQRMRQYGAYIGVEYGEPFYVREAIKIEDPVALFDVEAVVAPVGP